MKIALLTNGIWPFVIGGMQKHSFYLCKYLSRNKIEVELYHTTMNGSIPDLSEVFTADELKYIKGYYVEYPKSDRWPGHYIRSSYNYSVLLYNKLIDNADVDIIYIKGLAGLKLLSEKNKGKRFSPVFLNVHGYEYYQKVATIRGKMEQFMFRPVFRKANERTDYIFSYGGNITSIITKHIKNSEGKIIEIPAAIERDFLVDEVLPRPSPRKFVFIGRFERRKGIQELFKALNKLPGDCNFSFHFIGAIPISYRKNAREFVFHGELEDKEAIQSVLKDADVLVCPSYAEGMPNVILEGMACGCAIIGTNVGAIPIEVDSKNGWLIAPGSVNDLYKALIEVIKMPDQELERKRIYSLRKVRENFLWDVMILDVIKAFNNALLSTKPIM